MAWKSPNTRTTLIAALAALVLVLVLVPAASAGKTPRPGSSGTITVAPLVYDANLNGLPNWGDVVTFNVSTTATTQPYVNLQCFENGVLVANGWNGFFNGALNTSQNFGLNSGAWTGGAADCTAWLDMYTKQGWKQLASTGFHVDA